MGSGVRLGLLALAVAVGVTVGVLPPYLDTALARFHAGTASDEVAEALAEARTLAVSRSRTVVVVVDEELRSVSVEGGRWRKLPSGVAMAGPKSDASGRRTIVFRPDGSSSGGQVVVSSHGLAVSVLVERLDGRVRLVRAGLG